MYKPAPLGIVRPGPGLSSPRPGSYRSRHPEAWPRLYSPAPRQSGSNRAGSRHLPAWLVAVAGLGLVLVAEYGPDLVAHFIWGG